MTYMAENKLEPYSVLTIEDDAPFRRSIKGFFEDYGITVWEAGDGETGLSLFREKKPSVVLVDIRMPGMGGMAVIDILAREAPEIPIVVLSGAGTITSVIEAIRKGAWDYIDKPVRDMAHLQHVISNVLERSRLREENRRYQESLEMQVSERTLNMMQLNNRLKSVVQSTWTLAGCSTQDEAARQLLNEFSHNVGSLGGSIYLVENDHLMLKHAMDPGHASNAIPLPLPVTSVFGRALAQKAPVLILDIVAEKRTYSAGWNGYQDGSLLVFPFFDLQDNPLGVVSLHNKAVPPFTDQDIEIGSILAGHCREILKATRAMDALRASETQYRELVEKMNDAVYAINSAGIVQYVSPAIERMTGFHPSTFIGSNLQKFFHEEEAPKFKEAYSRMVHGQSHVDELRLATADGNMIWIRASSRMVREKNRSPSIQGILTDITERVHTRQALERSIWEMGMLNQFGREIGSNLSVEHTVNSALAYVHEIIQSDAVVLFIADENTLTLNKSFPGRLFHNPAELEIHEFGKCLCGLAAAERKAVYSRNIHSDLRCTFCECKQAGVVSAAVLPLLCTGEVIGILGILSFSERDFQAHATFLEAVSHELAIGLNNALLYEKAQTDAIELEERLNQIKDVEKEKEQLMSQLQHSQKMEAIGTLAGGIAHDFNNILTPIIMGSEMSLIHLQEKHPARQLVEKILKASVRAKDLVQHILTFSRQGDMEMHPVQISLIIKETIKMFRSVLPTTIEIQQRISFLNDWVIANPTQIHQVLMNLITNAAHAMGSKGGQLTFILQNENVSDPAWADAQGIQTGQFLKLQVIDTGHGMDSKIQSQIFDPFFTTKERGEGTGLGLSITHGIIRTCGGTIQVMSRPNEGTTFTLLLPVVRNANIEPIIENTTLPAGKEKILLIDDEEYIVEVVSQLLRDIGYTVDARRNSLEALNAFTSNPDAYDMIITDMTMPQLTGVQLATRIMQIRNDIPIILCTGFSSQIEIDTIRTHGIRALVMKPLAIRELAHKIREVLSEPQLV